MSFPTLEIPSDSLYKSMTFSGIFGCILGVAALLYGHHQVNHQLVEVRTAIDTFSITQRDALAKVIAVRDELNKYSGRPGRQQETQSAPLSLREALTSAAPAQPFNQSEIAEIKARFSPEDHVFVQRIADLHNESVVSVENARLLGLKYIALNDKYTVNRQTYKVVVGLSVVAILIGFTTAVAGVILWYRRLQKFQDLLAAYNKHPQ